MMVNKPNRAISFLGNKTIEAAASGDVDAINVVLKHYERYIVTLSTRRLYDEFGIPHLCLDEAMRRRLETKLITKLLKFDAKRIA